MKNKKIKVLLFLLEIVIITFQLFTAFIAKYKDYYLLYDWIFYLLNYVIIVIPFVIFHKYKKYSQLRILLAIFLVALNTIYFYKLGTNKLIVSQSPNKNHELILKEYKNINTETIRLKRKFLIYGKKVSIMDTSLYYKTFLEGNYKIDWLSDDIAVVTYISNERFEINQDIFPFRDTGSISYYYVLASITGKWTDKSDNSNYLIQNKGELTYSKNGDIYNYTSEDITQYGILAIMVNGNDTKPSFTVILNSDCEIENSGLIKDGGTITIMETDVLKSQPKIFNKENI
ncbi:MAG: hypothetical protein ACRC92_10095 [Peptostreptococcaceae bacterium]